MLTERLWQTVDQIEGGHGQAPEFLRREIAGQTVHVDTEDGRVKRQHSLSHQCRNHARKDIPGTSGRQSGVARFVDVEPFSVRYERAGALKHHRRSERFGEFTGRATA